LRALAALGVVATHARYLARPRIDGVFISTLWQGGRLTVFLFFAVSGYLIAGPFLRALLDGTELPELRTYAARRIARIVPAYWVALTALLVLGLANTPPPVTVLGIVDHYLLIHSQVPPDPASIYPVAWTLGIEAMFYLLVPLLAVGIRRITRAPVSHLWIIAGIGVLTVGSIALQLATYTRVIPFSGWSTVVQYSLPSQFMFFSPGMLFWVLEHRRLEVARRPMPQLSDLALWPLMLGAAALWFGSMYLFIGTSTPPVLSSVGFVIASAFTLALARCRRQTTSIVGRGFAWVGLVSYGLYLWHWIAMHAILVWRGVILKDAGLPGWAGATALLLMISLPIAGVSWYKLELPAMRLARRLAPSRRADGSGAPLEVQRSRG
jgi:Predicted acyltransferases